MCGYECHCILKVRLFMDSIKPSQQIIDTPLQLVRSLNCFSIRVVSLKVKKAIPLKKKWLKLI